MQIKSKADAQQRADQVGCFQAELDILEQESILSLQENQRAAITDYHKNLIAQLASVFDIDASEREKQFSLGMKLTSFLGALGLAASVFFLFYQFWGRFSTNVQVIILVAAPLLGLAATMYENQDRDKKQQQGKNTIDLRESGELMMRHKGNQEQNQGCREEILRSFANVNPIATAPCTGLCRQKEGETEYTSGKK